MRDVKGEEGWAGKGEGDDEPVESLRSVVVEKGDGQRKALVLPSEHRRAHSIAGFHCASRRHGEQSQLGPLVTNANAGRADLTQRSKSTTRLQQVRLSPTEPHLILCANDMGRGQAFGLGCSAERRVTPKRTR